MKKFWRIILSLVLLLPAQVMFMLFVFYFDALTGQLGLGYALGCILFGALAAVPVVRPVWRREMTGGQKLVRTVPVVCLYAAILMLSVVRIGGS